jgi:uncharacterized OsmC-like protein
MSVLAKSRPSAFPEGLKALFEAKAEAARRAAPLELSSARARVRLAYGVACDVEHEDRAIRVDLPAAEGGGATGPHPGQLMRASLGACLVMGYRIWAARLDVPLDDICLEISCEYDVRGQLGVDPTAAVGWKRVVVDAVVRSPAKESDVRRVIDTANRLSPMLANLAEDVERVFQVRVLSSDETERDVPSDVTPSW